MKLEAANNQPLSRIAERQDAPKIAPQQNAAASAPINDAGKSSKLGELQNQANLLKFNAAKSASSKDFSKEATVTKRADGYTIIDAGAGDDKIGVSQNQKTGEVTVKVNGASQTFSAADSRKLIIKAGDGNDTIKVGKGVTVSLQLEGGAGNDTMTVDKSVTAKQYLNGSGGDDKLTGGAGNDVIYGGDGNDQIDGGTGDDYLEGSNGNDTIRGGKGKDVLSGGIGDDTLRGGDGDDTLYAGQGKDQLFGDKGSNTIYSQKDDKIEAGRSEAEQNKKGINNKVVTVELKGNPGGTSVVVTGTPEFRERVEADLEMLRSSPTGRKMLEAFDAANAKDAVTVTIVEQTDYNNGNYADWQNRNTANPQPRLDLATGKPGTPNNATIGYYPGKIEAGGRERPPVVGLFHEMAHAYDFTHGTLQNGVYDGTDTADKKSPVRPDVNNLERVAVGLPIDHDNDPKTAEQQDPNHSTDLTENGLRKELGLPDRPSYR